MANGLDGYPRVKTFSVPSDIAPDLIGDYVTCEVHKFLIDLGDSGCHRKSVTLKPLETRLWQLTFNTNNQFTFRGTNGAQAVNGTSTASAATENVDKSGHNKKK